MVPTAKQKTPSKGVIKTVKPAEGRREIKHTLFISTKYWSKYIQALESQAKLWASWTYMSMTCLRESPDRLQDCLPTMVVQSTISIREIQTAVRLLLPGDFAKRAVSEGNQCCHQIHQRYINYLNNNHIQPPSLLQGHFYKYFHENQSYW